MAAPGIAPRILCIGIPVRDLTFRVESVPARGSKANASHLAEICGGNALNASIAIARLGGHVFFAGPMGDARETSSGFILDQMAQEGIDTTHIVRMPDMTTPVSAIMIDPSGERTLTIYRDPGLWRVKLPNADELLADCRAVLVESRCASFCVDLCAEARRRGIPVIVGVDRAMSLQDGLLTAASHLLFASEQVQETAGIADDAKALQTPGQADAGLPCRDPRSARYDLAERGRRAGRDGGLPGPGGRYARRRRRLSWRLRAWPRRG
ncbi:sugar/nucleoside kinase (ribokinase family) [Bradyrhizobium ottawaense]